MCLLAFSYDTHPHYPLIVVANRDEFYERPTAAAHYWEDAPTILAGRDLRQNGSWIGLSKNGRFAAITNYRDPSRPDTGQLSRGVIVQQFLTSSQSTEHFILSMRQKKDLYGGFNVLLYDGRQMQHYNNIFDVQTTVEKGVHSLSNATLNTPWPKVTYAKDALAEASKQNQLAVNDIITLLATKKIAPDEVLPDTGVGIHLERALSASFVKLPNYGTRCSTAIIYDKNGRIEFLERTYEEGKDNVDRQFEIDVSK